MQTVNRSGFVCRVRPAGLPALALLLLAGCFLDPAIQREQVRREAFDLYTKGQDLERRGEYQSALDLYLEAIERSPRPAFYYSAGVCHSRMGHDAQALDYLDRALAMAPDYEVAKAERDLILQRMDVQAGEKKTAPDRKLAEVPPPAQTPGPVEPMPTAPPPPLPPVTPTQAPPEGTKETVAPETSIELPSPEEVRRAVFPELFSSEPSPSSSSREEEADKKLPEFHYPPTADDQARLAVEGGRFDQGAFYLEEEVKARPDDWDLRLRLARVLARSGRLSRAEAELREAARLAPENAEVWYEWGGFYVRQENWGEADRCYRVCLRIDPDHAKARNNLGVVLLRLNLPDQAYEQFEELVQRHPEFASAYINMAILEAQYHHNIDQAVEFAEDYLRYGGARADEVRRWRQSLLIQKGSLPTPAVP